MQFPAVLFAEGAGIDDRGLLHLQGAGWEYAAAPAFPHGVAGFVAGVVEFGPSEIGKDPLLQLHVTHDGGQDNGSSGSIILSAHRQVGVFAIPFTLAVREEVIVTAELSDGAGNVLHTLTVPVRHLPAPPSPDDD